MTGWSKEASTTSAMKLAVVTSLTGAAPAAPPPIKGPSDIGVLSRGFTPNMAAWRGNDKRRATG
jgi:hypothetical protein